MPTHAYPSSFQLVTRKLGLLSLLLFLGFPPIYLYGTESPAGTKTWMDKSGSLRVEAKYLRVENEDVVLKRLSDGKEISVPVSRLSKADQAFLAALRSPPHRDIFQELQKEISVASQSTPLEALLRNQFPLAVWFDRAGMESNAIYLDSPVTISTTGSAAEVLDQVLAPLGKRKGDGGSFSRKRSLQLHFSAP